MEKKVSEKNEQYLLYKQEFINSSSRVQFLFIADNNKILIIIINKHKISFFKDYITTNP